MWQEEIDFARERSITFFTPVDVTRDYYFNIRPVWLSMDANAICPVYVCSTSSGYLRAVVRHFVRTNNILQITGGRRISFSV